MHYKIALNLDLISSKENLNPGKKLRQMQNLSLLAEVQVFSKYLNAQSGLWN